MIKVAAVLAIMPVMMLCEIAIGAQQAAECDANTALATLIETVRDHSTRVPLAGAVVTAAWPGNDQPTRARVDSMGKARICAPPGTPVTLRVAYHDIRTAPQTTLLTLARPTEHTLVVDAPGVFLRGSIADESGAALANVAVRIVNTPLVAVTSTDGKFYFARVPIGDYTLRVEHISYATVSSALNVRDEDLDAVIRLTPAAIPIAPIVVTAFSRRLDQAGFYERQKRGVGTFIGRKQIDEMNVQNASDLMRLVPGVRLTPQPPRRNASPNMMRGRGNCRFRFIIDGTRMLQDFEMDFMSPGAIEGVEVYKGMAGVPSMFRAVAGSDAGGVSCGVIAIWTRDGR